MLFHPLLLLLLPLFYLSFLLLLFLTPNLQRLLIYLPFIRPPFPPSPTRTRISNHTRTIRIKNLSGWHVVPPGPPFPSNHPDFEISLSAPAQRVFLFFHGTCGTRAFPSGRTLLLMQLSAHFAAHVITIDYSGFADSEGYPSEEALKRDALVVHEWLMDRLHESSSLFVYGMSLGSFPALSLAARVDGIAGVITDSALANLLDAVMTHPFAIPIRVLPYSRTIFSRFLADRLDNLANLPVRTPLLILHALHDGQIPYEHARMIYEAAVDTGCDVDITSFMGVGHNNVATADGYLNTLHKFITKCERVV